MYVWQPVEKRDGVPCPRLPWACKFPRKHAHGKRGHGTRNRSVAYFNGSVRAFATGQRQVGAG